MTSTYDQLFTELGINSRLEEIGEKTIASEIASELNEKLLLKTPDSLPRWAWVYEEDGFRALDELAAISISEKVKSDELKATARIAFARAFQCWRALLNLNEQGTKVSQQGLSVLKEELLPDTVPEIHLAFRLAATGVLSEQPALVRLELQRFKLESLNENISWIERVASTVFQAFALLTRKGNGWKDIDGSLKNIALLKTFQSEFEDSYLNKDESDENRLYSAVELVGYYHLAQMMTITGEYLQTGKQGESSTLTKVQRHEDNAEQSFRAISRSHQIHVTRLLSLACKQLIRNSIWSHSSPGPMQDYIQLLVDRGNPNPILELWPAQQKALFENVLSTYHRAILVEMPTSAGKTLLAKFAIVQTKALAPEGTIAYVVPTRALVNQITMDLRSDFKGFKKPWRVEQTIPAFELDPTEDRLLQSIPDVLVTTPEKLDFLLRKGHPAVSNLAMVVADEAHNIADNTRGVRLELLLGMIKRDSPNTRFLLLSPFLPENQLLLEWLGEDKALDAIMVEWRPSNRVVGGIALRGSGTKRRLTLETLPAIDNSDIGPDIQIPIGSADLVKGNSTIENLTHATTIALRDRGSVFVLCKGKKTATERAQFIANNIGTINHSDKVEAVCRFIETEAGTHIPLSDCLRKGVAYHHGGLSHESRWLIEKLAKEKLVNVICGTTTLAQGINFPISTVIVESLRKGDAQLTYTDFWNIAGRAGRTMVDTVGIVGFPLSGAAARKKYVEFLRGEAEQIASQLTDVVTRIDEMATRFDLAAVRNNPGLTHLLQFLAHAMKIAGKTNLGDEVEDILRSSLVYHQLRKSNKETASKLIRVCRNYLDDLGQRNNILPLLQIADKTGFATPSIFALLAKRKDDSTLADLAQWLPETLFGSDISSLTKRIEILSQLPEIKLGTPEAGEFRADLLAGVVRDWVNGDDMFTMAQKYPHLSRGAADDTDRLTMFSQFLYSNLLGKASWGLGALESVYLSGSTDAQWNTVGYVPAMVFYGVTRKESIWLRMSGVPRTLADGLGKLWSEKLQTEPTSYDQVRSWVSNLSDDEWKTAIPSKSKLRPQDCKILWNEFST